MATEGESLLQTSGFCPPVIKSTVSTTFKKEDEKTEQTNKRQTKRELFPALTSLLLLSGAESSPALLSPGRRGRRSSTQEKKDACAEKPANEDQVGKPQEKRPGEPSSTPCFYCHL